MVWLALVMLAVLMWSATGLLYKIGVREREHVCLKFSICVGTVFFVLAFAYLMIRDEEFTIWESAVKYWPMTLFGIVYAIVNTISYKGYVYNEVTVESPVEGISGGVSVIFLIVMYLLLGRADSVWHLLTPLRTVGIAVIVISVILLAVARNKEKKNDPKYSKAVWMRRGLGTLIFPVVFSMADALETITTGICLDTTYGYSMPQGDSVIIVGTEYALFALGFWIYVAVKEKKPYNPFKKKNLPCLIGAVTDNVGIVCYSYAMAINSISTDPLLALYPIASMLGGRFILKEKIDKMQCVLLVGVVVGSVMVVADTVFCA